MAKMILIDTHTLAEPDMAKQVKEFVVEYLVRHPDTAITLLNSQSEAELETTQALARSLQFPFDAVTCNPLTTDVPVPVFKIMLAGRMQADDRHQLILVVDDDEEALGMWKDSGVEFTYNPTKKVETNG